MGIHFSNLITVIPFALSIGIAVSVLEAFTSAHRRSLHLARQISRWLLAIGCVGVIASLVNPIGSALIAILLFWFAAFLVQSIRLTNRKFLIASLNAEAMGIQSWQLQQHLATEGVRFGRWRRLAYIASRYPKKPPSETRLTKVDNDVSQLRSQESFDHPPAETASQQGQESSALVLGRSLPKSVHFFLKGVGDLDSIDRSAQACGIMEMGEWDLQYQNAYASFKQTVVLLGVFAMLATAFLGLVLLRVNVMATKIFDEFELAQFELLQPLLSGTLCFAAVSSMLFLLYLVLRCLAYHPWRILHRKHYLATALFQIADYAHTPQISAQCVTRMSKSYPIWCVKRKFQNAVHTLPNADTATLENWLQAIAPKEFESKWLNCPKSAKNQQRTLADLRDFARKIHEESKSDWGFFNHFAAPALYLFTGIVFLIAPMLLLMRLMNMPIFFS